MTALLLDERGSALAEFALVLALFSMVAYAAVAAIGSAAGSQLSDTQNQFVNSSTTNLPSAYSAGYE